MTVFRPPVAVEGLAVLAPVIRYLFQILPLVRDADPTDSTPCPGWSLADLLQHLHESLGSFIEILGVTVKPADEPERPPVATEDTVRTIQNLALDFVLSWMASPAQVRTCRIEDREVSSKLLLYVAATEMVLHGWDISQSCGAPHPIPDKLAEALLPMAPQVAEAGAACGAFAAPIPLSAKATPGRRLLATYGRRGHG